MNKINEATGPIKLKLVKPIMNRMILVINIRKLVLNIDLVYLYKWWCRWSCPASNKSFLFFILIKLIDRNSYTKIETENASKIGWANFFTARNIKTKDMINPSNKLPLSPKNIFGSFNIEKLKHKKINNGIKVIIKNSLTFSSGIKKIKMLNTEIVKEVSKPSKPSK